MSAALIVVVVLMVLLIGFVLIVLYSLSISAGIRIRSDMVRMLESYDKIIEDKSRKIRKLTAEIEKLESQRDEPQDDIVVTETAQVLPKTSLPSTANYRTSGYSEGYTQIRDSFSMNSKQLSEAVEKIATEVSVSGRGQQAQILRDSFSFDTVFKLSQRPSEDQLELLDTNLSDSDWTLLRDYCEILGDSDFTITGFCDWLEEKISLESDDIYIRSGSHRLMNQENIEYWDQICEGVQIIAGNTLYDYSIKEREIS